MKASLKAAKKFQEIEGQDFATALSRTELNVFNSIFTTKTPKQIKNPKQNNLKHFLIHNLVRGGPQFCIILPK